MDFVALFHIIFTVLRRSVMCNSNEFSTLVALLLHHFILRSCYWVHPDPRICKHVLLHAFLRIVLFCIKKRNKTDGATQWARLIRHCEHIVRWIRARYGGVATESQLLSFTPFLQRQAVPENNKWCCGLCWFLSGKAARMQNKCMAG